MKIKQRITKLRDERGWSEYELSKQTGIAAGTVYDWKNKGAHPTLESIEAICSVCEISLSQFFAEDSSEAKTAAKRKLDSVCENLTEEQIEVLVAMAKSWKK